MSESFTFQAPHGESAVIAIDDQTSWWQPVPANGYASVVISPRNVRSVHRFSFGTQIVPPGGMIRLHAHDASEELLYVLEGHGIATVEGIEYPMKPGTTLYLGHNQSHTFLNTGEQNMKWLWYFMPGGLEDFFAQIGRPRAKGESAPESFARPSDVKEIERKTVFANLDVKS